MPACVVSYCKNHHDGGYVLVQFPRDVNRRQKWRDAVGVYGPSEWLPSKDYRICEVHFNLNDWIKYRRTLKAEAVPSIFQSSGKENKRAATTSCKKSGASKVVKKRPCLEDVNFTHFDHSYSKASPLYFDCWSGKYAQASATYQEGKRVENLINENVLLRLQILETGAILLQQQKLLELLGK